MRETALKINLKRFFWSKKLKILFHRHVISDLNREEIVGTFQNERREERRQMKGATKTNETDLNIKKVIRKNPISLRQMKGL